MHDKQGSRRSTTHASQTQKTAHIQTRAIKITLATNINGGIDLRIKDIHMCTCVGDVKFWSAGGSTCTCLNQIAIGRRKKTSRCSFHMKRNAFLNLLFSGVGWTMAD